MPTPLPDAERRRLVQGLIDRNVPPDRIKSIVNSAEGYGQVDLSGPQGIGAAPLTNVPTAGRAVNPAAEAAADMERMQRQYNQWLIRGIPSAAAAVALSPVTAGMSLPMAMGADFAGMAGADLLTQIGMHAADPSRPINPMESAKVGAYGAATGGAVRGGLDLLQRGLGGLGGIPQPAISEVTERAPLGGPKAFGLIRPRPSTTYKTASAESQLAESAQQSILKARSRSYPTAEAAVDAYQADVDTAPIYQHILSRLRTPIGNAKAITGPEAAANKALEDLADSLPDKMKMSDLDDYLGRIRESVKGQYGQVGGSMKTQDVKSVTNFVRQYRDQLLSGTAATEKGPAAFAASSTELEAIKRFRKLLLDTKGNLKPNAEQIVRRMPTNRVLMKMFERYDAAMGTDYAQQAKDISLSRAWNPTKQQAAASLIEATNRIGRGTTLSAKAAGIIGRGGARTMAVVLPPRGLPSRSAAAYEAFQKAMEQEQNR